MMTLNQKELETVKDMLFHESPIISEKAFDILISLVKTNETCISLLARVIFNDSDGKLLRNLLELRWKEQVGRKLLTLLINLSASSQIAVTQRLCELLFIPTVIGLLDQEELVSKAHEKIINLSSSNRATTSLTCNLLLVLLANLTNTRTNEAIHSLFYMNSDKGLKAGFYVEKILDHFKRHSRYEKKWLLYIIVNISGNIDTCRVISSHESFLQYALSQLQEKLFCEEKFKLILSIVRNIALNHREGTHGVLIESGIADAVMQCFQDCTDEELSWVSTNSAESIFFLCMSKSGIQWMESINGKQLLLSVLEVGNHAINSQACSNAKALLRDKLLTILDDIQDVNVTE